ncbi:MAG TPA: amino acid--tRNA ligase-related protein, partial [Kofleriaceae bacterium]|nr:amino acid--tRNA ligase-related protein [Kofleriaceae bacterium]
MATQRPPDPPDNTLDRIIGERRAKGAALRATGSDPYRNDLQPAVSIADVRSRYAETKPTEPPAKGAPITPIDGTPLRIAGRAMVKRGMGKTVFVPVRDATADIQLYLNVDHLHADDFANVLPQLDAGDIVVAEGPAFWTQRGELSILVSRFWITTKSLRPLPDKFHGLADQEQRYRQRHLDLIVNEDARATFRARSTIVAAIRRTMTDADFLEVETPMLQPIPGGAAAKPFVTHHNALDQRMFLRIAPELYLKRLIVGGFERVFEINRNFRNEGISPR